MRRRVGLTDFKELPAVVFENTGTWSLGKMRQIRDSKR